MQQAIVRERTLSAQAIALLVTFLVALGVTPALGAQQAWADSGAGGTLDLSLETNTNYMTSTSFSREVGKTQTLYVKFAASKSTGAITQGDLADIKLHWYEKAGDGDYALIDGSEDANLWNSVMSSVSAAHSYTVSCKAAGTYTYKCVASGTLEDYAVENAESPEYTIVVTEPAAKYAISKTEPVNGTVFVGNADRDTQTEATAGANVELFVKAADGYEVGSVLVKDASGQAVTVTQNTDFTMIYSFTMPASNVTVEAAFTKPAAATKEVQFNVYDDKENILTLGTDYTMEMKDSSGKSAAIDTNAYDMTVAQLSVGETYSYTIAGVKDNTYKQLTGTYTCTEAESRIRLQLEPVEQQVADPTLTLVVEPAEAANLVQVWGDDWNNALITGNGSASVKAGTEYIEVSFSLKDSGYELDTVNVEGAEATQDSGSYWLNMPSNDVTVNVKLKSTAVQKTEVAVPTGDTNLVYTGAEQTGAAEGEGYTLADNKATDAGNYTATATLAEGYVWNDGTDTAKTIEWSIAKLEIAAPTAEANLVANGSEQTGVKDGEGYTLTGNKATEAGNYTATATADKNHVFAEGKTEVSIAWTITAATTGSNTGDNTGDNTGKTEDKTDTSKTDTSKTDTNKTDTNKNADTKNNTNNTSNTNNNNTKAGTTTNTGSGTPLAASGAKTNTQDKASTTSAKTTTAKKAKKANTMTVKAKTATVKASKVKKKAQTLKVGKVLTVKKAKGKLTYAKKSGNKKITINKKTGKVTVKKGLKKGTYKVKVQVKAAGNASFKAKTKTVTFKVKVK